MARRIAVVDPTSRTLPYDFYFIKSLSSKYLIDFYCSKTDFNNHFADAARDLDNVRVKYFDHNGGVLSRLGSHIKLFYNLFKCRKDYESVNAQWLVFPYIELFFYFLLNKKVVFTIHNDRPHSKKGKSSYFPFYLLNLFRQTLLFVSDSVLANFSEIYGNKNHRNCFVLNHGVLPITPTLQRKDVDRGDNLERIIFWGTVKDYKGVDFLLKNLCLFDDLGLNVEVHGKFDSNLLWLKDELLKKGVKVEDKYLSESEVIDLLHLKNSALILPYRKATQSGVMYTSLYYSLPFLASNSGDNASFLRANQLDELIFDLESEDSLKCSLDYLSTHYTKVIRNFRVIRRSYDWEYSTELLTGVFDEN